MKKNIKWELFFFSQMTSFVSSLHFFFFPSSFLVLAVFMIFYPIASIAAHFSASFFHEWFTVFVFVLEVFDAVWYVRNSERNVGGWSCYFFFFNPAMIEQPISPLWQRRISCWGGNEINPPHGCQRWKNHAS